MRINFNQGYSSVIPIVVGIAIFSAFLIGYFEIENYQKQIAATSKEQIKSILEGMVDRRESRIETIASSIIGFYEGSQQVDQDEFKQFSKRILKNNPEIFNIFVLKDKTIIQTYPNEEYLSQDFDLIFPSFPVQIDGNNLMAGRFTIFDDLSVIILFPPHFFVIEDDILLDDYKLVLSSDWTDKTLYEIEKKSGTKSFDNVKFTNEELGELVKVSKKTNVFGHKINEIHVLDYQIWDDSFSNRVDINEVIIIISGVSFSVIIPVLLYREMYLRNTMRQIDKQKSEFLSMMSHELKTPLTPMMIYSDMLLKYSKDKLDETQRKQISVIYEECRRLAKLIEDLSEVNKIELKKLNIEKQKIDIKQFLENEIENIKSLMLEKNINFVLDLEGTWTIYCDPGRISQVISNLIRNSIDYVPQNGRIVLRAKKRESHTIFTVEDNGVGISPKDAKKIFKKFYQVDTSVTRQHGGTGLGLTISKGIIEAHNGRIWLDTKYKGGAKFEFTVPE
ncbi:MAG: ATP-binding protein [Nitrososphaerota archaeon]